jgi:DegV family protein with EDD domain
VTVGIVTDSAAGLDPQVAAAHGIVLVPIWIHLDGRMVQDGTIGLDEVLAATSLSTSGPAPGEFAQAIAAARERHDEVLVLTVAASLSATHDAARIAASELGPEVAVLDTGTAAGGQALVALAAAREAGAGGGLVDAADEARRVMSRVRVVGSLSTYAYLVRSGRVPGLAARAAHRLRVRPMFELRHGTPRALRPVIGDNDLDRLVARCTAARRPGARVHAVVMHAGAAERAEKLSAALAAEVDPATLLIGAFGAGMVAHAGPGVLGLAWWWEEAS